jgi:uncharacterized protein
MTGLGAYDLAKRKLLETGDEMPDRDGYIPGVPCWVDTSQPNPEATLPFYTGLFGWEFENVMPEDSGGKYFIGRIRGGDVAAVGTLPPGAPAIATWNTYVWVDNADESAEMARKAGGSVLEEPFDIPGAGRMAVIADPEGATFSVWQAKGHKGAQVVNEHGSLNFNILATRDPARAGEFYGAVFGWQLPPAPSGMMWWALPGYADHLEQSRPGLRKQAAEMGAPEGFVDVVAALVLIAPDDPSTRPSWGVTFGVDDASSIATKAKELGGQVLIEPFDAPWTRSTVIKDPEGAIFTATQFVPENKNLTM